MHNSLYAVRLITMDVSLGPLARAPSTPIVRPDSTFNPPAVRPRKEKPWELPSFGGQPHPDRLTSVLTKHPQFLPLLTLLLPLLPLTLLLALNLLS